MVEHERAPAAQGQDRIGGVPRLLLVLGGWMLLAGSLQLYAWQQMLTPVELAQSLLNACRDQPAGWLIFIGAAALSPLLLLPAALLGCVAGICFGPAAGVVYTLIGCNLSATITYGLGRLSPEGGDGKIARLCRRYGERLRRNPFLGVVVLRLSFLPYDPLNYLVGVLRVGYLPFLAANTLGSLPGVIAIVLAGTSVGGLDHGLPMIDLAVLSGAAITLLVCLGLALLLRHQLEREDGAQARHRDDR